MTDQPQPTPPGFVPIPAVPIIVLAHRKGDCQLMVGASVFAGPTLRDALTCAAASKEQEGRNG